MSKPDTTETPMPSKEPRNAEFAFFYDGLTRGELLIQKCGACGKLRNPPSPSCPHCHSLQWTGEVMSGKGHLYSYVIHHYPPLQGFDIPLPIGLIALHEGIRFLAALAVDSITNISIGMPVSAVFTREGTLATVRFKPVERR